ncbi:hypothetical protein Daus18300_007986 [Diaporthe australafricana]|uniref:Heterokaryon incompatibility domain-containing protein n=1 Tax=Diaporthe australafricana TaxID=127596 RepID=A0ABR3WK57_9PEZI
MTQSTPRSHKDFNYFSFDDLDKKIDADWNNNLPVPGQAQATLPGSCASNACDPDQSLKENHPRKTPETGSHLYRTFTAQQEITPHPQWRHPKSRIPSVGLTTSVTWGACDAGNRTQVPRHSDYHEIPSPRNSIFQESKATTVKLSDVAEEGAKGLEQLNRKVLLAMETQPLDRRRSSVETVGSSQRRDSEQIRFVVGHEKIARSALASEYIPPDPGKSPYQPLIRPEGQIRLFRLAKASQAGEIRGSFVYCDTKSCPKYTALSYAWGEPAKTRKITIETKDDFEIGENLWWFLYYRSLTMKSPRLFWIDAICIDQSNVSERNHQVSLMKQIYSMASNVYIWLGTESENSRLAMDFLANEGARPLKRQVDDDRLIWDKEEGQAIRDLCARPYWNRMWIIQEIIHANRLTVWCGPQRLDWPVFDRLYLTLKNLQEANCISQHDFATDVLQSPAFVMVWQRAHWRHPETPTPKLQTLIEIFQGWKCTDLRDKVYALVSMADENTAVQPDYSRSSREIYRDVLRRGVGCDNRFCNLLSQVLGVPVEGTRSFGPYVARFTAPRGLIRSASD